MLFGKKKFNANSMKLPIHIGFIMDGNGRWAIRRGMPRTYGHKQGVEALKRVVEECYNIGIKYLSFFVFSTENWKRPKEEVDYIFGLAGQYTESMVDDYLSKGVRLTTLGDLSALPSDLIQKIKNVKEKTKNNSKMIVNLCVNYGGRNEIVRAVNKAIKSKIESVDETSFRSLMESSDLPDPDIIVRASGEQRVSNFLIYEMAYSEFMFIKDYWPDFNKNTVRKIILDYQKRNRRFGSIK